MVDGYEMYSDALVSEIENKEEITAELINDTKRLIKAKQDAWDQEVKLIAKIRAIDKQIFNELFNIMQKADEKRYG